MLKRQSIISITLFVLLLLFSVFCEQPLNENNENPLEPFQKLWSVQTSGLLSYHYPKYYNGRIYCTIGGHGFGVFNASNGDSIWTVNIGENVDNDGINASVIAVDDEQVYFNHKGRLYIYTALTGEYKTSLENMIEGTVVDAEIVYTFSNQYGLSAHNKYTGKRIWNTQIGGRPWSVPVIEEGFIYICANSVTSSNGHVFGQIIKLEQKSGDIIFRKTVTIPDNDKSTHGGPFASPLVSSKLIIVENGDYRIYAYDKNTSDLMWVYDIGASAHWCPLVTDNENVFFGTSSPPMVCAIDLEDGHEVWRVDAIKGTANQGGPKLYQDFLFLASLDSYLYCLDKNSGNVLFKLKEASTPVIHNDTLWVCEHEYSYSKPTKYFLSAYKINY